MYYLLFAFVCILNATTVIAQFSKDWSVEFLNIGTHSSPRATDLTNDGIKDLIIGCGKKEFQALDSGIIAVDGSNGKLLWHAPARDQMFGSAAFLDINRDGLLT